MIRRNNGEKRAKLFAGISMIVFSIIFCSILVCMVNMRQGGNSIIMKEDIIADIDNGIILEEFDDEFDEFDDFDEFSHANNAFSFALFSPLFLLIILYLLPFSYINIPKLNRIFLKAVRIT